MRPLTVFAIAATVAGGILTAAPAGAQQQAGVTAFEGARLILGDGRVIENGTFSSTARGSPRPARPPMSAFPAMPATLTSPARP